MILIVFALQRLWERGEDLDGGEGGGGEDRQPSYTSTHLSYPIHERDRESFYEKIDFQKSNDN